MQCSNDGTAARRLTGFRIIAAEVAFEADDHDVEEGWSVVVKGRAYVLGASEFAEAERGQVLPWTTTAKNRFHPHRARRD